MNIIKQDREIILLEQYGNKYIRYDIGGKGKHDWFQLKITEEEFNKIQNEEVTAEDIIDHYEKQGFCSFAYLRNSLIKDYIRTVSNYPEEQLDSIISRLAAHTDIYFEFHDFVLHEQFPEGQIAVADLSDGEELNAQYLVTEFEYSPLDAYIFLIDFRETPMKLVPDLLKRSLGMIIHGVEEIRKEINGAEEEIRKETNPSFIPSSIVIFIAVLVILAFIFSGVIEQTEKRATYSIGEETSQTNEYNNPSTWKTLEEWQTINSDVVGVLEFSDRQFPVVQTNDNETYLNTSIYGVYDIFGVPFVDYSIDLDDTDNIIIYAHSTYSKDILFTFFSDYINNPDNVADKMTFTWTDETGTYEYRIIAATQIDANSEDKDLYWYESSFTTKLEKTEYVVTMLESAQVVFDTSYDPNNRLITLVTCNMDNDDERYILTATMTAVVD